MNLLFKRVVNLITLLAGSLLKPATCIAENIPSVFNDQEPVRAPSRIKGNKE